MRDPCRRDRPEHASDAQRAVHRAHEVLAEAEVEQEQIVVQEKNEQRKVEERGRREEQPELASEAVHAPPEAEAGERCLRQGDGVMPQAPRGVCEIAGPDARAASAAARRQIAGKQAAPRHAPRIRAAIEQADMQPQVVLVRAELLRCGGEGEGVEPRLRGWRAGVRPRARGSQTTRGETEDDRLQLAQTRGMERAPLGPERLVARARLENPRDLVNVERASRSRAGRV